jgi:SRSO17 transposase
MAEATGEPLPDRMQRLLYRTVWDAEAARDILQDFVWEQFGETDAIGVVDETGFLKWGDRSVGVKRQYTGTAGKVENCQVAVFLSLTTREAHVLLDRELYLPQDWCTDQERREKAGVPKLVGFQTKPQLGVKMLERAWGRGLALRWVVADEVYGNASYFRRAVSAHGQLYVVTVSACTRVWVDRPQVEPERRSAKGRLLRRARVVREARAAEPVSKVVAAWPADQWERLKVADGEKGPITHDWARQRVVESHESVPGETLWLLARRCVKDKDDIAYYLSNAPEDIAISRLAQVATARWTIEQCFRESKGETGLDEYEVRLWHSWYRHITLAMMAHAWLASVRSRAHEKRGT